MDETKTGTQNYFPGVTNLEGFDPGDAESIAWIDGHGLDIEVLLRGPEIPPGMGELPSHVILAKQVFPDGSYSLATWERLSVAPFSRFMGHYFHCGEWNEAVGDFEERVEKRSKVSAGR